MGGIGGYAVLLPAHMAERSIAEAGGGYVSRPLVGVGTDFDFCAFVLKDAPAHVASFFDAL